MDNRPQNKASDEADVIACGDHFHNPIPFNLQNFFILDNGFIPVKNDIKHRQYDKGQE